MNVLSIYRNNSKCPCLQHLFLSFLCCREKKMSRTSGLKVLDHGMIGPEGADNCHKFVDILGLRTIFPLFMKTPKKLKKTGPSEKEHEGQSLVLWLISPKSESCSGVHCFLIESISAEWDVTTNRYRKQTNGNQTSWVECLQHFCVIMTHFRSMVFTGTMKREREREDFLLVL